MIYCHDALYFVELYYLFYIHPITLFKFIFLIGKGCYKKDCKGFCHLWSIQHPVLGARQECAGKSCSECGRACAVLRCVGPESLHHLCISAWGIVAGAARENNLPCQRCGLTPVTLRLTALPAFTLRVKRICLLCLSALFLCGLPKMISLE